MKYNLLDLGIMVEIISFLGFVVENVWLACTKGYINNRNMNTPFLLGYGLLVLVLYFLLGTPTSPSNNRLLRKGRSNKQQYIVYFFCCFIAVCVGEIMLGTIVEKLCSIEYWNYSNLPLHITKYTSVFTSIGFAALITFFMGKCFTPLMEWISGKNSVHLRTVSAVLLMIMTLDFFDSFHHMIVSKNFYSVWKIKLSDVKKWIRLCRI